MSDENKTIHRKHFMGGKEQPHETHRRLVMGGKECAFCGGKAALSAKLLAEEKEFISRHPNEFIMLMEKAGGDPCFDTKYGKMLVVDRIFACEMCDKPLRAYASKQPSWILVEFDEGGLSSTYATQVGGS